MWFLKVISNIKKSWRRRLSNRYFRFPRRMTISTNQTMSSQADCDVAENDVVPVNFLNTSNVKRPDSREVELTESIGSNGNPAGTTREGRKVSFANFPPSHPTWFQPSCFQLTVLYISVNQIPRGVSALIRLSWTTCTCRWGSIWNILRLYLPPGLRYLCVKKAKWSTN